MSFADTAAVFLLELAPIQFDNGARVAPHHSGVALWVGGQIVARAHKERNTGNHVHVTFSAAAPCQYTNAILARQGCEARVIRDERGLRAHLAGESGPVYLEQFSAGFLAHCALFEE